MTETIRVLLADDHPLVRDGIRAAIMKEPDIALVGEAVDGHQVEQLALGLQPDVLLLDLNMPELAPYELVVALQEECPEVRVLVLTAYDDPVYVRRLISAGVAGYLLKDEATKTIVQAIRTVAQDGVWLSPAILKRMMQQGVDEPEPDLTERETEVLHLLAKGFTNKHIADTLKLSERTVRFHLQNLYSKLHVGSRAEAIVWSIHRGFGKI